MLLARLEDGALIRCDCMIMKRRNAMLEQLTRRKRLRPVKFLISSKCHRAYLGSESQPARQISPSPPVSNPPMPRLFEGWRGGESPRLLTYLLRVKLSEPQLAF